MSLSDSHSDKLTSAPPMALSESRSTNLDQAAPGPETFQGEWISENCVRVDTTPAPFIVKLHGEDLRAPRLPPQPPTSRKRKAHTSQETSGSSSKRNTPNRTIRRQMATYSYVPAPLASTGDNSSGVPLASTGANASQHPGQPSAPHGNVVPWHEQNSIQIAQPLEQQIPTPDPVQYDGHGQLASEGPQQHNPQQLGVPQRYSSVPLASTCANALAYPVHPSVPQYLVPPQQNLVPFIGQNANGSISTTVGHIKQESNAVMIFRERWRRVNSSPFPEDLHTTTITKEICVDLYRVLGRQIMSAFLIQSEAAHIDPNTGEVEIKRASTFFPYFWDPRADEQMTRLTWEHALAFELLAYGAEEAPQRWIMTPTGYIIQIFHAEKVDPVLYALRRQGKSLVRNLPRLAIPGFIPPTSSILPPTTARWDQETQSSRITFYDGSKMAMIMHFMNYLDLHTADMSENLIGFLTVNLGQA